MSASANLALYCSLACGAILSASPGPVSARDRHDVRAEWSAPPSIPVVKVDKPFANGPDRFGGTLFLPSLPYPVPAVVVFHAASTATREAPLFRHLVEMLPPLGVAVFVYDRRGSGASTGKPAGGDYPLLADDGLAAVRMLARDSRIDSSRIGFWGLSQGGWLALLGAAQGADVAFAIAVSAPMTTPDVQMNFAVENILRIKGHPQSDIDIALTARKAVDDFQRGRLDRATAQQRLDRAAAQPWFDLIYLERTLADPEKSGWAREIRNDPLPPLLKVRVPTLILYGAGDPWVPVRASLESLRERARSLAHVRTAVIDRADHFMMLSVSPAAQIDPGRFDAFAPEAAAYFSVLTSWLTANGFVQPRPGATGKECPTAGGTACR